MNKSLHILSILYFIVQGIFAQDGEIAGPPTQAVHNTTKYNGFLFNPAFSFNKKAADSGDKNGYISVYGRLERVDFEDAPSSFNATYVKTINEKMSLGGGLFQQNIGAITHFGGILNYTYNLEFNRDVFIAFGGNVSFQTVGLKSDVRLADPIDNNVLLGDFDGASLLRVSPGFNINYKNFDFGAAVRNIVSAQLGGTSEIFDTNTIVVHGAYSRPLARRSPNTVKGVLYVEKETAIDPVVGVNGFIENEKYGFAQIGYNQTFGVSFGLGFNITPQATIGYTVERGFGNADVFGFNHEFTLAYNFVEPRRRGRRRTPTTPKPKRQLPERKELTKAEKILALQEARQQQTDKLAQLRAAQEKAALLRTQKLKEAEEKDKASELVRTVTLHIEDNNLEKAKASLDRIKNSKYISEEDKRALIARYTKKLEIAQDIEEEESRIAEETKAKNEARALLARTTKLLNDKNIKDAQSTLELIASSKYISEEEKQQIRGRLQRIISEKKQSELAALEAEKRKNGAELLRTTSLLLDENNLEEAKAKATLIRQNKYIPDSEKQQLLARLETKVKEAQDRQQLITETEEIISNGSLEEAKARATLVRSSTIIPEEEKQRILSSLTRVINKKEADLAEANRVAAEQRAAAEAALAEQERIAEEQRKTEVARQQLVLETEEIISNGSLEEAKARATLVRSSTIIPEEEKQRILSSLTRVINKKEADLAEANRVAAEQRAAAEAALAEQERIAEEQRKAEEARQQLVLETEEIISNGSLEEAKARATLVRSSTIIPEEEKQRILSTLTRVINKKEADLAEANRVAAEQRAAAEAALAEQERIAEEQRKAEEARKQLIAETEAVISSGSLEEAKARATLVRSSTIIPEEEKQRILSTLTRVINKKETDLAEANRVAAEQRAAAEAALAEQERIAEEQRKAEEARKQLIAETEAVISSGSLEEAKSRATLVRTSTIIPEEEKQRILSTLTRVINKKEADLEEEQRKAEEAARIAEEQRKAEEAARIAEEQRKAEEAARIAEEQRKAEEARKQLIAETEAVISSGSLEEAKSRATLVRTSTIIPEEEKQRILSTLTRVINKKEADLEEEKRKAEEAARIAEEQRKAEEAARIAEEKRKAEEAARIAEEQRKAEEARKQLIAETEAVISSGSLEEAKSRATLVRTSTIIPEEEKQRILSTLTRVINKKEADLEEEKRKAEEAARIAEEKRKAEEAARIAEEKRKAEEAARIAEEKRKAEEAARIAEEKRKAEEERARKAEERKAEEAARIAEEKRKAEEAARIAEEKRKAEEAARIAEEKRKAEEAARIAEEKRKAEEAARIAEEKKEERRKAVQAALKRTTKKVQETQRGSTLKRTLLPQQGSEKTKTNSNGMGFKSSILEKQHDFFMKELLMKPQINIHSANIVDFIDALVKSSNANKNIVNERVINLDKKKGVLKTKLKAIKTSEK